MTQWTIESPTSLDFEDVTGLRVRLIAGSVAVLATDGKPSLDVANITGDPLHVSYEDGLLTISHENLTWEGLLKWLRPHRHPATVTVTVPRQCQTQVGVVSATAVMSGISAKASVKSVSGGTTPETLLPDSLVTVPRQCQTQVGVVSATAVMSGISAKASVKSVSGGITLETLLTDALALM